MRRSSAAGVLSDAARGPMILPSFFFFCGLGMERILPFREGIRHARPCPKWKTSPSTRLPPVHFASGRRVVAAWWRPCARRYRRAHGRHHAATTRRPDAKWTGGSLVLGEVFHFGHGRAWRMPSRKGKILSIPSPQKKKKEGRIIGPRAASDRTPAADDRRMRAVNVHNFEPNKVYTVSVGAL